MHSNCPICDSFKSQKIWEASCSEQACHFISPLEDRRKYEELKEHIRNLQKKQFVALKRCLDCNFIYSSPYIAGDKEFYDLIFSERNKYPKERWEFQKSLDTIKMSGFKNPKILEIGSGDGAFLKKLIKNKITIKSNLTAIEYSDYGRSKIESLGINCFSIDIKKYKNKLPHEKYDFICLFQVLEHMDNINQILVVLKNLLTDEGEIIISVPNEKIIEFNERNGALLDMPPNHIGRWSKSSFKKFCDINRVNLAEICVENFSFKNFLLMFFSYRFLKKSQNKKSIAAFIKYKNHKNISWIFTRIFIILDFLSSPWIWLKIFFVVRHYGGETQLCRISKIL